MASIQTFTIFAPQRSGTNFLQQLIVQNFEKIRCFNTDKSYLWKHEPNSRLILQKYRGTNIQNHLHLVLTKNPYKWIESIIRKPVDIKIRRPEVLNIDVDPAYIIKLDPTQQKNRTWQVSAINLVELVKLYNEFYNNWLDLKTQLKYWGICKYENLLIEQDCYHFLYMLQNTYKLSKIRPSWIIPSNVSMTGHWDSNTKTAKTQDYLDFNRCKTLTQQQIDIIDQTIDKALLEKLGYPLQKPSSVNA